MSIIDATATLDDASLAQKGHCNLARRIILAAVKSLHRDEISRMKQQHARAMDKQKTEYVDELSKQRKEIVELCNQEARYIKDLRSQEERYTKELSKQKTEYFEEIRKQREEHDKELSEQKDSHAKELLKQKGNHAVATRKLRKELIEAGEVNSAQAEEPTAEKAKRVNLEQAFPTNNNRIMQPTKKLPNTNPTQATNSEKSSASSTSSTIKTAKPSPKISKPYIPCITKHEIIALFNGEIKYHNRAILNLQPKYRPVDCYVRRRIKRTEKAHNTIHQALDEGSLGVLRQQALAMRSKYEPLILGKAVKPQRPSMQDIMLLLQCLDKAMNMVVEEKENILSRLEGVGEEYVEQHRERIKNMFALAERLGLLDELEWVQAQK